LGVTIYQLKLHCKQLGSLDALKLTSCRPNPWLQLRTTAALVEIANTTRDSTSYIRIIQSLIAYRSSRGKINTMCVRVALPWQLIRLHCIRVVIVTAPSWSWHISYVHIHRTTACIPAAFWFTYTTQHLVCNCAIILQYHTSFGHDDNYNQHEYVLSNAYRTIVSHT